MSVTGEADSLAIRAQLGCPNLTAERERHLLETHRKGCDEKIRHKALKELWESHSKLVVAVARQYRRPDLEIVDLVGAGHLGMHAAIEGFDPDRFDTRLSTYAIGWIRHYIQDYISRHAFPVRPPASTAHRQLLRMTGKLFAEARQSCHRDRIAATDAELCARVGARVGLSGDEVAQSLSLARGEAVSFDAVGAGGADMRWLESQLVADEASPEETVMLQLDHAKLRERVRALAEEILGDRERRVFFARCLCDDEEAMHLESLAAELSVSRERVHQLELSAKRKIAVALARDGLIEAGSGTVELPKSRARRRGRTMDMVAAKR
jgi:RNA polymerase sigma factor (sigma-70 family)